MINYSIIIPHKDIPNLLQRCLDSIPHREDIQIIIVDDNSGTDKVDFDSFPGLGRENTEVYFTKEGKGAGYARNIGLQHAKGKWLIFSDADDFFMPCFNEVLDLYKDDENDLIYFKVTSVDSETMKPHIREQAVNPLLSKVKQTNDWNILITHYPPWGKMVKQDIIRKNNIVFQEVQYSNDVYFSMKLGIVNAQRIISDYELYCVTYRNNSLAEHHHHHIEALYVRFAVSYDIYMYLRGIGKEKYFYHNTIHWWIEIARRDYKFAISVFPKMIKNFGLWYPTRYFLMKILNKLNLQR